MANLSSRRALKAATTAIRIVARLEHPKRMTGTPRNQKILYQSHTRYASLKVDVMVRTQQLPWMTNAGHQIITTLCALPKGAGTKRIRAEMRQVIENEELSDYDVSLKEEKVGCAVILPTATLN
jgi:hypothetical protein